MTREDEFRTSNVNPAKYFLEWKSADKCFVFYDKEKSANKQIPLPFKFLVLKQMHTVTGFSEHYGSGIYSNEVYNLSKEELHVRSHKGGFSVKGLYDEIKDKISHKNVNGKYAKSIYAMTSKGELVNIKLMGAGIGPWFDFTKDCEVKLRDYWVSVSGFVEKTKGNIGYSEPVFEFSDLLSKEEKEKASGKHSEIHSYITGKSEPTLETTEQTTFTEEEEDDLPF